MAAEKLIAKLINMIAQSQAKKETLSRYAAPRRDDVLHDGMVGSGEPGAESWAQHWEE
ncbi:hypothetical protein [Bradyrhizobium sp. SZCCHNR1047]|uniref:hypothetical protein n=1 Tax=Bradyrhizobium sp. SZCCHNR1047 TaxID=3057354 RepID=UPI002916DEE9|nr:hypothetical protein [Bradyrhizobium sp. SZCCHNR1047]